MIKADSLFFFLIPFILLSCDNRDDRYYSELNEKAETNPREVLSLLDEKQNNIEDMPYDVRMRFSLLRYKVEDKCYVEHNSDSIINILYDYFSECGSIGEKMEVNYYMGSTYRDMKNYPLAVTYYFKAADIGENNVLATVESMTLANVYSQLSQMNGNMGKYSESLDYVIRALRIRQNFGVDDFQSYQDVANSYLLCGQNDSASCYYERGRSMMTDDGEVYNISQFLGDYLNFQLLSENKAKARETLDMLYGMCVDSLSSYVLSKMANYYTFFDVSIDSFEYFTLKSYEKETDMRMKSECAKRLFVLYNIRKDEKKAADYAFRHFDYEDSALVIEKINDTKLASSFHQSQQLSSMRKKINDDRIEKIEYTFFSLFVFALLTIIVFTVLMVHMRSKIVTARRMDNLKTAKDRMEKRHLKIMKVMEADTKLRIDVGEDLSPVLRKLHQISRSYTEVLIEDTWAEVFHAIDTSHPNFRGYVLSYNEHMENKDLIIIYLAFLGIKQADMARLFKNARSVINRRIHRLEFMLGIDVYEMIDRYLKTENKGIKWFSMEEWLGSDNDWSDDE